MQSGGAAAVLPQTFNTRLAIMGSFGATVASLLETYTKCLSLLKGFARSGDLDSSSSELQSSLGSSLRSDRARVRRAYSTRLSQNGRRLEKGDAASRSALRRVAKRLTAALGEVVSRVGGQRSPTVDYNSLLALSKGSSLDAVRTINDLSSRVSSKTSSVSSQRSTVSRGRPRSTHHHQQSEGRARQSMSKGGRRSKSERSKSKQPASQPSRQPLRQSSRNHRVMTASKNENRISILTMSSDSTKLGEIRRRQSRQGLGGRATYPMHLYPHEEEKGRKKWWKLFGSG
ncbi:hypothetical protein EDB81DRAFT_439744 [Dactylonectria macrodidyma]|uniref:Uncharacterized protein n=1 Tax=Dactylonectria macrodidyma TaxID=307937 RepID=A0A9P9JB05_9HYPO|nr:hypothetical protein EDB81DRAFT_439744 [Dactylonectria macrodidyma]